MNNFNKIIKRLAYWKTSSNCIRNVGNNLDSFVVLHITYLRFELKARYACCDWSGRPLQKGRIMYAHSRSEKSALELSAETFLSSG